MDALVFEFSGAAEIDGISCAFIPTISHSLGIPRAASLSCNATCIKLLTYLGLQCATYRCNASPCYSIPS